MGKFVDFIESTINRLLTNYSLFEIVIFGLAVFSIIYVAIRFFFTKLLNARKAFSAKTCNDDANLLGKLMNLSADMLLIIDNKNKIKYANDSMLKVVPIVDDSSINIIDNKMRFKLKGDIAWVTLEELLDLHIERDSGHKSVFHETEMKSEITTEVMIEISTHRSLNSQSKWYYAIGIHNMECKKKLFNMD